MTLLNVSVLSAASSVSNFLSESSSEGPVNVDLDLSLFVQVGLFLLLLVLLKPALFDPMLRLFDEREERIDRTRERASKEDQRSAKALAKYEAAVAKGRETGARERDQIRANGTKREAAMMAEVRNATGATLDRGRAALQDETRSARANLATEANALAREIASRVLGREVSS